MEFNPTNLLCKSKIPAARLSLFSLEYFGEAILIEDWGISAKGERGCRRSKFLNQSIENLGVLNLVKRFRKLIAQAPRLLRCWSVMVKCAGWWIWNRRGARWGIWDLQSTVGSSEANTADSSYFQNDFLFNLLRGNSRIREIISGSICPEWGKSKWLLMNGVAVSEEALFSGNT